jgi:kumamolisin
MKTLISHIPPLVHLAKKVGPLNPQQQLSILIQFQQTHSSDIAQLIQDQQNPHSPNYGKHLTSEQFNQQFSQSKSAIQEQASKLTAAGFLVDKVNPQGIRARASVKQIESFFHTQLWVFQRPDAKTTFYAPIEELQVSADSIIATVIGLDTAAQIHRASPPSP